jgi:hypothetical protein
MTTTSAARNQPARSGALTGGVVGDDVVQSGGADKAFKVEVLGTAERAEDGEFEVDIGAAAPEQGSGLEQDLRAFEALDPAGEEQMECAGGDAVGVPGWGPECRGEDGEVNAGGCDVDVVEVGAVVGDKFGGFGCGVGDQAGGAVDDAVFAVLAAPGFGLFAGVQEEVFDFGHGVHGVHQGDVPQVGEFESGDAGDPVVGVDEVVAAVGLLGADALDFGDHAVQQFGEFFFGEFAGRAGQDVVDADAGVGVFDGGLPGCGGAGEDLHFDAGFGQGGGKAADVDVHAAGVPGTGLFHGGCVQRQESHTLDHRHGPPSSPDCRNCWNCIG